MYLIRGIRVLFLGAKMEIAKREGGGARKKRGQRLERDFLEDKILPAPRSPNVKDRKASGT